MGAVSNYIKNSIVLTELQRQFILGGLLGDLCIRIPPHQKNPILQFHHSIKQVDYILYKYNFLLNLCKIGPRDVVYKGLGNLKYRSVYFRTRSLPCLLPIHDIVMQNGYKTISEKWLDEITHPIALASWYFDDGNLQNEERKSGRTYTHRMRIALGDTPEYKCELLRDWLKQRWGVSSIIKTNRTGIYKRLYRNIYIYRIENLQKMKNLIEPYSIPSMNYKLNLIFKGDDLC
jgi:hypothetical protein